LRVLDREIIPGVINTRKELEYIKRRFGIEYVDIPIKKLAEKIDEVNMNDRGSGK